MNYIERMLFEDVQEKKKIGRGVHSRRGKGVKHRINGIKTPYDFMTNKEKKKLNSKVRSYNMNTILDKFEFRQADQETQKMLLMNWRETQTNKEIAEKMGISVSELSRVVKELELPRPPKRDRGPRKSKTIAAVKKIETVQQQEQPQPIQEVELEVKPIQQAPIKLITNGLHLEYNGTYNSDQLSRIFTKLQLIIDGDLGDYYLTLALTEKEKEDH